MAREVSHAKIGRIFEQFSNMTILEVLSISDIFSMRMFGKYLGEPHMR